MSIFEDLEESVLLSSGQAMVWQVGTFTCPTLVQRYNHEQQAALNPDGEILGARIDNELVIFMQEHVLLRVRLAGAIPTAWAAVDANQIMVGFSDGKLVVIYVCVEKLMS